MFTEVIEPHWSLLAAYIISTKILQQLAESEETMPTYGELLECLNQLITDPMAQEDNKPKGTCKCSYVVMSIVIIFNMLYFR